jgi:CRP-like cAMP-binding protein
MCSIPKKNLYQVIREAKILPFVVGQNVYTQGQLFQAGESGSCVYLVRKGEFGCFKQIDKNSKAIEAYRYNKGNIFGHIEHLDQEAKRKHTVKCKTNQGTIYSFPPEIFRKLILPYCHSTLVLKQQKLMKSNSASFSINSQPKSNPRNSSLSNSNSFSGDTLSRRFSHTGVSMELPNISQSKNYIFTKHNNPLRESQRIEEEGLNKTNYFTLTKEGPLKHYPMASKRANFIDS